MISRNTSFKYKGQAVDVKKIASELGVQYVAEGSVRRAGNRVRVTVQLIDAAADNPGRARLLGLRAVVSRMLGDLRPAHSDAKMALVHAEATGQLRRIAVAQARLANVLVRLGELAEADQLFARGHPAMAAGYLLASLAAGLTAVYGGILVGRLWPGTERGLA